MTTCVKCLDGQAHDFEHGTLTAYSYHKCRCDVCLPAWNEYQRGYKRENREHLNELQQQRRLADLPRVRKMNRENKARRRQDPAVRRRERESQQRHYHFGGGKERQQEYRQQDAAYNNEQRRRRVSRIPAPNGGKRWTPEEDAVVLREDITVIEMCYLLGRSEAAVICRRQNLDPAKAARHRAAGQEYRQRNREKIAARRNKGPYAQPRICDECRADFVAVKPTHRFCSSKCKERNHNRIPAPRNRVRWTAAEKEIIMRDISVTEACELTGRAYGAVTCMRMQLRRRSDHGE